MTIFAQIVNPNNYFVFFLITTYNKLAKTVGIISRAICVQDFQFFLNVVYLDTLFVMMTSWLVITRDPTRRQVAKMVKVVSGMLGWIIVFLLKKISRKNLIWLARTVGYSKEAPFWARNFSIFRNHENRGLKNSKNHVFSRFHENGGRDGFFRIFPISFSLVLVFFRK